ncbi:uncharacterized protein BX664DRAFT_352212 [Halteromyces radiatus]|uniref:uncharacterized protein n=1 Tax=Halteromyces radiatus TaxID=101107 RepID=UPI00221FAE84|nr:uncharacterized protein BX664DRAFT_352212 [Halteromyces radiatus]KAI8082951.1 hypothetical protein BX664DRAFT_352212 [Halteromyces radiatus]
MFLRSTLFCLLFYSSLGAPIVFPSSLFLKQQSSKYAQIYQQQQGDLHSTDMMEDDRYETDLINKDESNTRMTGIDRSLMTENIAVPLTMTSSRQHHYDRSKRYIDNHFIILITKQEEIPPWYQQLWNKWKGYKDDPLVMLAQWTNDDVDDHNQHLLSLQELAKNNDAVLQVITSDVLF